LRGKSHRTIDPHASKNPRPAGAESTLTENASSPFHAEPRQKTNDDQVTRDAIVTEATGAGTSTLKEIRFGRQKEALVFDQNVGGL